jgi:hypothetical protein
MGIPWRERERERERERGKLVVGSTKTKTNYHLLGMLVFLGVLVPTNTKVTHILGFFLLV